jgi:C-terminal processing protease CtpA/Prc
MAEYYFPSVGITNKKWSEVLTEYIPKFLSTDSIRWTTVELIAELSDTHSMMSRNPVYSRRVLPVELKFVEGKLVVTDNRKYLATDGELVFALGDEIISIEGHTPDYFIDRARRYIAASNENALLRDAAQLARTVSGDTVSVVVKRDGKTLNFDIATISVQESSTNRNEWLKSKPYYELMDDPSIGYMYSEKFKNGDSAAIMEKFKDTKAIIIDLRCYPSGFMPFEFTGRYFVPKSIHHVTWAIPFVNLPGYYKEYPQSLGNNNKNYYKGKVVVLVNEMTQSKAEYTTLAFQATPNCVVVGSQTAGADGNVSLLLLPRNIKTRFSGLGVFYPDGTNTQRAGIRIDHYVEPTIEGIRAGRDEVLEKALEIIEAGN